MNSLYSLLYSVAFILMLPVFFLRRSKYAAGFRQRLGDYPETKDPRPAIWLHCVSVGELNAAKPLIEQMLKSFTGHRLVISTTTRTGQDLAGRLFSEKATVVYFPFDFKFSVRKALRALRPSVVLLMETEIWPRFIREAKRSGAAVALVNGRLSARSARRYSYIRPFLKSTLADVDLALMQADADAKRIAELGADDNKIHVTGNIKFDLAEESGEFANELRERFAIEKNRPLIIAASTHEPEEEWILEAFAEFFLDPSTVRPRLMIAPRHPERFDRVESVIRSFGSGKFSRFPELCFVRRSAEPTPRDVDADVILLDTIGELASIYSLAEVVVVGGSFIPHGGQSILEPAAAGNAIITGPHTHNFADAVRIFTANQALIQIPENPPVHTVDDIFLELSELIENADERDRLGTNAGVVMKQNRGAAERTFSYIRRLLQK
jgi:3-deoxy-D-manno-octulosonic-acid transferase